MLLELVVENYAVIDRLRVHFHPGLNLLTGETGSGKSIVVDALGLLFGSRASAEMIRTGEARARVAGIFDVRELGLLFGVAQALAVEHERDLADESVKQVALVRRQRCGLAKTQTEHADGAFAGDKRQMQAVG